MTVPAAADLAVAVRVLAATIPDRMNFHVKGYRLCVLDHAAAGVA